MDLFNALSDAACLIAKHGEGNHAFHIIYRWMHYASAAAFLGLLLFFNLLIAKKPGSANFMIGPDLLKRVFWFWRWAAMVLLFSGLNLLHMLYNFPSKNYFGGDRGVWMLAAAGFGVFEFCVAWFYVWPAQKRHFAAWSEDEAFRPLAGRAESGLRLLSLLTPTTLIGMGAAAHGLTLLGGPFRDMGVIFAASSLPLAFYYLKTGKS